MKKTLVINDLHLGVSRSAGTTPQSAAALKAHLHEQFAKVLRIGPSRVITVSYTHLTLPTNREV